MPHARGSEGFVSAIQHHSSPINLSKAPLLNFQKPEVPSLTLPKVKLPELSVQGACNLLAGGVAGAVASAITCPLEVVKTNLQSRGSAKMGLGPLGMARKIVAESGVGGLYRGLSLSMMGIIPTRACYFWAYGATKGALTPAIGDGPATHMLSAIGAGGLSSTVTCPIWMVKTRMQLQGGNVLDTAGKIVNAEGVRGLYRGLGASYWGLSEGALQFFLYEKFKVAMQAANARAAGHSVAEQKDELATWQYLLAGGVSKGLASIATYPHEVVRTRMREAGAAGRYINMPQSLRLIAREEGRRGLYGGLGPHLLRVVPNTAIMFMSFEVLSRRLPVLLEQRPWEDVLDRAERAWVDFQAGLTLESAAMTAPLAFIHRGVSEVSSSISKTQAHLVSAFVQ